MALSRERIAVSIGVSAALHAMAILVAPLPHWCVCIFPEDRSAYDGFVPSRRGWIDLDHDRPSPSGDRPPEIREYPDRDDEIDVRCDPTVREEGGCVEHDEPEPDWLRDPETILWGLEHAPRPPWSFVEAETPGEPRGPGRGLRSARFPEPGSPVNAALDRALRSLDQPKADPLALLALGLAGHVLASHEVFIDPWTDQPYEVGARVAGAFPGTSDRASSAQLAIARELIGDPGARLLREAIARECERTDALRGASVEELLWLEAAVGHRIAHGRPQRTNSSREKAAEAVARIVLGESVSDVERAEAIELVATLATRER